MSSLIVSAALPAQNRAVLVDIDDSNDPVLKEWFFVDERALQNLPNQNRSTGFISSVSNLVQRLFSKNRPVLPVQNENRPQLMIEPIVQVAAPQRQVNDHRIYAALWLMRDPEYKETNGQFTAQELGVIGRNGSGHIAPFKDFFDNYPYRMLRCDQEQNRPYPETVVRTYVAQVLGLNEGQDPLDRMNDCLNAGIDAEGFLRVVNLALYSTPGNNVVEKFQSAEPNIVSCITAVLKSDNPVETIEKLQRDVELRKMALQLHAFFKLIGNKNVPLPENLNLTLVQEHQVMVDPIPAKTGRMIPTLQNFGDIVVTDVKDDVVELYTIDDIAKKNIVQEQPVVIQPLIMFNARRRLIISPVDNDGNVSYKIVRTLTALPRDGA
jgi:hypothetical protein